MMHIEPFVFNYFSQNTYLLYDESKEAVLIDCGCVNSTEKHLLTSFIDKHELNLKAVLMTHMHLDHAFGLSYLYNTYGLRPRMHKYEYERQPSLSEQAKRFVLPVHVEDVEPGEFLQPGEEFRFGETRLKIDRFGKKRIDAESGYDV